MDDDEDLDRDDIDPEYRERELAKRMRAEAKGERKKAYILELSKQGLVVEHLIVFYMDSLASADDLARDIAERFTLVDPIVIGGEANAGWLFTFRYYVVAAPDDVWDSENEELREQRKVFREIAEKHGCRLLSIDEVDSETFDDWLDGGE